MTININRALAVTAPSNPPSVKSWKVILYRYQSTGVTQVATKTVASSVTSVAFTGLTATYKYQGTVTPINGNGEGDASSRSAIATVLARTVARNLLEEEPAAAEPEPLVAAGHRGNIPPAIPAGNNPGNGKHRSRHML